MVLYLSLVNASKLATMMNKKFHIEPENIDEMACADWFRFMETNDGEPFKRFLPEYPAKYYVKGNPDYAKQWCVEHSIQQGKTEPVIVKECGVSSKDIKEYIEINRIIEELEDIEELIKNYKKRD